MLMIDTDCKTVNLWYYNIPYRYYYCPVCALSRAINTAHHETSREVGAAAAPSWREEHKNKQRSAGGTALVDHGFLCIFQQFLYVKKKRKSPQCQCQIQNAINIAQACWPNLPFGDLEWEPSFDYEIKKQKGISKSGSWEWWSF